MIERSRADVAIVGAGFAGSLTAMILHRIGLRVILLERDQHPRFALGEASTPFANLVLLQLAKRYKLSAIEPLAKYGPWKRAYPGLPTWRKRGFSFFRHHAGQTFKPSPDHAEELLVAASRDDEHSDTHWYRPAFDTLLVEEAQAEGVPYFDQTLVTIEQKEPCWSLHCKREDQAFQVESRFLIDASGPGGFLTQALGLSSEGHDFRTCSRSVYTHLVEVKAWREVLEETGGCPADYPYPCDHSTIHHIFDGGWMWVIPFDNGITSVGLMLDCEKYRETESLSAEEEWQCILAAYPSIARQFCNARPVEPWRKSGRLQRLATALCGPNWAMLPHAAYALDALFSIGNGHTLLGLERLVTALEQHWNRDDLFPTLQRDAELLCQEVRFNDALIAACYRSFGNFRLFAATSMFYFAGAHAAELARCGEPALAPTRFLSSQVEPFSQAVMQACDRLTQVKDFRDAAEYEAWVRQAIAPVNFGGFADPSKYNLYPCE